MQHRKEEKVDEKKRNVSIFQKKEKAEKKKLKTKQERRGEPEKFVATISIRQD